MLYSDVWSHTAQMGRSFRLVSVITRQTRTHSLGRILVRFIALIIGKMP